MVVVSKIYVGDWCFNCTFFNFKPNFTPNGITRWNAIFPNIQSEEWQNVFLTSFRASRETSLQSLQFRILSYVITCHKKLHEMKISDSPLCTAPIVPK